VRITDGLRKIKEKVSISRTSLIVIMLMIVVIGGTFAWFTYRSRESALVLTIGDINDSRMTIKPYQIRESLTPVNTYEGGVYSQIQVVNNNNSSTKMSLFYRINDLDEILINNGLRYTVVSSSSLNGEYIEVKTGDFTELGKNSDRFIILDMDVTASTTIYYRVYLWLDSNFGDQSVVQNLSLDIELNGYIGDYKFDDYGPVLDSGMIPVVIANDGTVTTVKPTNVDNEWYDYEDKKWANVVLVKESATESVEGSKSRGYYLSNPGTVVLESDILAYYVWIPRYRYKIWTNTTSAAGSEQEIDIVFEDINTSKSMGTAVDEYRTHPAFTFGDEEISGFWVGKFELTGSTTEPTVKPNVVSLKNKTVKVMFDTLMLFNGGTMDSSTGEVTYAGSSVYGLTSTDSHISKNSEWGAVAYLAHSKYGINGEIRLNNHTSYNTGCGALVENGANNATCENAFGSVGEYPQSTTGNITGVFDMAGGAHDFVMINLKNDKQSSGFSVMPESKYYDLRTVADNLTGCDGGLCYGDATFETAGWYSDTLGALHADYPFAGRGGIYSDKTDAGSFRLTRASGGAGGAWGVRSVLIVENESLMVDFDGTCPSGGTVTNVPNVMIKKTNVDVKLPTNIPVCNGYMFSGWSLELEDGTSVKYNPGSEYTLNESNTLHAIWSLRPNPVLDSGMIPVSISDDGTVTTVNSNNKDNQWYDYENKKWANVVLVKENATSGVVGSQSRSYYKSNPGTVVLESDILAYYVWIPRYKYKLWTTTASAAGKEQEIEIVFEGVNTSKSAGTVIGQYRTHPAFTFGDKEISGFWMGKFEVTGTVDEPTVKPNVAPLTGQDHSTLFGATLLFSGGALDTSTGNVSFIGSNYYGLTTVSDSHMIKNVEWGAVAYLSHSKYGINSEIRVNNYFSSSTLTGFGASVHDDTTVDTVDAGIVYGQSLDSEYPQSTTGNITGIFDMSGGVHDRVMVNLNSSKSSSGFSIFPSSKYYDLRTTTSNLTACNGGLCYGDASFETTGWYGDASENLSSSYPWLARGERYDGVEGGASNISGIFSMDNSNGVSYLTWGTRSVIISQN